MAYELVWTEGITRDFRKLKFPEHEFKNLESAISKRRLALFPYDCTKKLKLPLDVRVFKFHEYRLFLHIDKIGMTIYVLAFEQRKKCYNKESLNKIISQVKEIRTK